MSQIKQIVKNALELKQASPQILASVDTLLQRSIVRLQNKDLLPPRTLEFTSLDRKQEKRVDDDLIFNYYYLPDDFRRLDNFRPYKNNIYDWQRDETKLYQKIKEKETLTESERNKIRNEYTIVNTNQSDDSKSEKILIAFPFPEDDETIQIKYWVNGKGLDYDWIDEDYWEAIIADVETMAGLRSSQDPDTEERISDAVERHKELQYRGDTNKRLSGSFFGNRHRTRRRRNSKDSLNNL